MSSGHFICMAPPSMEDTRPEVRTEPMENVRLRPREWRLQNRFLTCLCCNVRSGGRTRTLITVENVNPEGGAAKLAAQKAIGRSLPGFIRPSWRPNRSPATTVPDSMGGLGGQDGPKALQEASRRRTATRAKRYAHSGFGDKGARSKGNRSIF